VIAFLHTPTLGSIAIGIDHVPANGQKLLIPKEVEIPDGREGLYLVDDVVFAVPSMPGRQRVDIYAKQMPLPEDLSYSSVKAIQ